jgi:hypothetical protein
MQPCTPHAIVTLDHSICYGGHFYCTQTMTATVYGILQCFVAGEMLTNTNHYHACEWWKNILSFWLNSLRDNKGDITPFYAKALDKAGSQVKLDGMFNKLKFRLFSDAKLMPKALTLSLIFLIAFLLMIL